MLLTKRDRLWLATQTPFGYRDHTLSPGLARTPPGLVEGLVKEVSIIIDREKCELLKNLSAFYQRVHFQEAIFI